jgi:hypothetical protein
MDHIGIDVHKQHSQMCILSEDGRRWSPAAGASGVSFLKTFPPRSRLILRTFPPGGSHNLSAT